MSSDPTPPDDGPAGTPGPGTMLGGKYRVERVLGAGGMGVVAEARSLLNGERVAIKFLLPRLLRDEEAMARFERETQALMDVTSEHVVRFIDAGRLPDRRPYLVMEYLEGQDLAQLLDDGSIFSVEQSVELVLQACEAVGEAHGRGIVHRDLKPENLFLTKRRDGSPCLKVLDFGLSKTDFDGSRRPRGKRPLTLDGRTFGTPNYISPEQWMGARDVSPLADQWTLGAILYELLTGEPAFDGSHVGEICGKALKGQVTPLLSVCPTLPPALAAAVHRALDKTPPARFPSVLEFAEAIAPYAPEHARISVDRIAALRRAARSEAEPGPRRAEPLRARAEVASHGHAGAGRHSHAERRPAARPSGPAMARPTPLLSDLELPEERAAAGASGRRRALLLLALVGVGVVSSVALALLSFESAAPATPDPVADAASSALSSEQSAPPAIETEAARSALAATAEPAPTVAAPSATSVAASRPTAPATAGTSRKGKGKLPSAPATKDETDLFGRR